MNPWRKRQAAAESLRDDVHATARLAANVGTEAMAAFALISTVAVVALVIAIIALMRTDDRTPMENVI